MVDFKFNLEKLVLGCFFWQLLLTSNYYHYLTNYHYTITISKRSSPDLNPNPNN